MKKQILTLLFAATTLSALAAPAKPGTWRTITLEDGTTIRAELVGDEHGHCWKAANGQLYHMADVNKKFYEPISMEKAVALRTKNIEAEKKLKAEYDAICKPAKALPLTASNAIATGSTTKYSGTKRCLVILVEFQDLKFEEGHDKALFERIINEPGYTSDEGYVASVRDFYRDQSYGTFDIDFTVAGPYTLDYNYSYYGKDQSSQNRDVHVQEMITEAIEKADNDVFYQYYDWNNDKSAELVFIIYAGRGQADGGNDDTIWPHKAEINPVMKDKTYISTYACAPELQRGGANAADPRDNESLLDGIGTICHEFSHCMDLPDAYDSYYSGFAGMGLWSIMAEGCYLGDNFRPCGYTAYEKIFCGWIDPIMLTENTSVEGMPAIGDEPVAYCIPHPATKNEYYLLENRQRKGWDSSLYGDGLLITHLDYDENVWYANLVNSNASWWYFSNDHQRYTFVPADGSQSSLNVTGLLNDPYPTSRNNTFSSTSNPNTSVYNINIDGTYVLDVAVKNITKKNGLISFDFEDNNEPAAIPEAPEGSVFYETFTRCTGFIGFSGTEGTFAPDNEGWSGAVMAGASQCGFFNTATGTLSTPEFDLGEEGGVYKVTFRVAPYSADRTSLTVGVGSGDGKLEESSLIVMKRSAWTDCTFTLTGTGKQTLTFKAPKRFLLDDVLVMYESEIPTGITSLKQESAANTASFNLYGQRIGSNAKGLLIKNGKIGLEK